MFNVTTQDGPDQRDPQTIDWTLRQGRALISFDLDNDGLPVNPVQPNLPAGRQGLWHWGEAVAADAIVTATDSHGAQHLLMVERADGHGWALPGGGLDEGESIRSALARELAEETSLELAEDLFRVRAARYVPDPRAGRAAWMVSAPGDATLHTDTLPKVEGQDDARQAVWIPANSFSELITEIDQRGGSIFSAHVAMLNRAFSRNRY